MTVIHPDGVLVINGDIDLPFKAIPNGIDLIHTNAKYTAFLWGNCLCRERPPSLARVFRIEVWLAGLNGPFIPYTKRAKTPIILLNI